MSDSCLSCFTNTVSKDFFEAMCGQYLGEGAYREVYRLLLSPEYVVKIEWKAHKFQNILEWDVWERVKDTQFAKWFAKCEHISPCGTVLVQEYIKDVDDDSLLPDELPVFFTDIKKGNFGIKDGQLVCRDYGLNLLLEKGLTTRKKKVVW